MDAKTKAKALSLINSASTSSFLVSVAATKKVMSDCVAVQASAVPED